MNVGQLRLVCESARRPPALRRPSRSRSVARCRSGAGLPRWRSGRSAFERRARRKRRVEDAVRRRAIVRTWPMRGTLHFVAAADVRWMSRLLTPQVIRGAAGRYRQLGLDDRAFTNAARVTERALGARDAAQAGCAVRRLEHPPASPPTSRAGFTSSAISRRRVSSASGRGKGSSTRSRCSRSGCRRTATLERDIALGELARRYFTSHGPATIQDFAWWSGLTVTDDTVRAGVREVGARERYGRWTNVLVRRIEGAAIGDRMQRTCCRRGMSSPWLIAIGRTSSTGSTRCE